MVEVRIPVESPGAARPMNFATVSVFATHPGSPAGNTKLPSAPPPSYARSICRPIVVVIDPAPLVTYGPFATNTTLAPWPAARRSMAISLVGDTSTGTQQRHSEGSPAHRQFS